MGGDQTELPEADKDILRHQYSGLMVMTEFPTKLRLAENIGHEAEPYVQMAKYRGLANKCAMPILTAHGTIMSQNSQKTVAIDRSTLAGQQQYEVEPDILTQIARQDRNNLFFMGLWRDDALIVSTMSSLALGFKVFILKDATVADYGNLPKYLISELSHSGIYFI